MIVTDKLASDLVAHRELMLSAQHRRSKYLNNRAENSDQPTRHRGRAMKRLTSIRTRHGSRRHPLLAADYRQVMADRFAVCNEITGATTMAAA